MTSSCSRLFGRPRLRSLSPTRSIMLIPALLLLGTMSFDPVMAAEGRRKKGVVRYLHTGQGGLIDVAGSIDPRIPPVKGIIPTPKWASAPIPLDLLIPIRYLKPPARPPRR